MDPLYFLGEVGWQSVGVLVVGRTYGWLVPCLLTRTVLLVLILEFRKISMTRNKFYIIGAYFRWKIGCL